MKVTVVIREGLANPLPTTVGTLLLNDDTHVVMMSTGHLALQTNNFTLGGLGLVGMEPNFRVTELLGTYTRRYGRLSLSLRRI